MGEPRTGGAKGFGLGGWFSGGLDAAERERQAALAAGREAYADAIRTGQNVLARTESEIISLGRSRLARTAAQSRAHAPGSQQSGKEVHDDLMQADALVRAAANKATFGLADHLAAAGDAVAAGGDMDQIWRQYQANLQQQRARDAYDAQFRPAAHEVGAQTGEVLSFLGGAKAGVEAANALSPRAKGVLGEGLSVIKTLGRRDLPKEFQAKEPVRGGFTRADHVTTRGQFVESKFGPGARLTPRQREAQQKLGPNYRVDRWGPQHIGLGAGAATGAASVSMDDDGR